VFVPGARWTSRPGLRAHLRYRGYLPGPDQMYGRYHITDANGFYTQANA